MQDQKLLTLHGCSLLRGGSDILSSICADYGSQYSIDGLTVLHSAGIIQDTSPTFIDALLPLNFGTS